MQNYNYKKNKAYYAMLVPINSGKVDKRDEFSNLWSRYMSLPKKNKDIVSSDKLVDFIYGASQRYNLNDAKTEEFSRTVRQYFFNEIVDGQFARKIGELCNTSNEEGLAMLNSIKNIKPEAESSAPRRNLVTGATYSPKQPSSQINFSSNISATSQKPNKSGLSSQTPQVSNIVQVPIKRALKLYPKLESQFLTVNQIVSKPFLKPMKPTIKNWLTVYEEVMGTEKKGAIDRGNFLFHSEAAKNLSTEDRQKLAQVLKSADEDSNLKIDTIQGEIIFTPISSGEEKKQVKKTVVANNSQSENPANSVNNQFPKPLNNSQPNNKYQFGQNSFTQQKPEVNKFSGNGSNNNFVQQKFTNNQPEARPSFNDSLQKNEGNFKFKSGNQFNQNAQNTQNSFNNLSSKQSVGESYQKQANNFSAVQNQPKPSLNNFSNNLGNESVVGGVGSDSFTSSKQNVSLEDLKSPNEENVQFTSKHNFSNGNK